MQLKLVTAQFGQTLQRGCEGDVRHRAFCLAWYQLVGLRLATKHTHWDETARALLYHLVEREVVASESEAQKVAWRALARFARCDNGQ